MSAPAMEVSGMVFLSKARPTLTRPSAGQWQLTLRAVHRIASLKVEPWLLIWTGDAAKAFHDANASELVAGKPLQIHAHQIRAHGTGPYCEIHAAIDHIEIHHHDELAA